MNNPNRFNRNSSNSAKIMFYEFVNLSFNMLNNIRCYNEKFSARVQCYDWDFKTSNFALYSCNACSKLLLLNEIYLHGTTQISSSSDSSGIFSSNFDITELVLKNHHPWT